MTPDPAAIVRYCLDPSQSRFTAQAFPTGLLSFLGPAPTFATPELAGELWFDTTAAGGAGLRLAVRADSLRIVGDIRPADRAEIESRVRAEVLDTAAHPEIRFEGTDPAAGTPAGERGLLRLAGSLSLRGVTRPHRVEVRLTTHPAGVRLTGGSVVRPSEFGIRPAAADAIRLKDSVRLAFDLVAVPDRREGA